MSYLLWLQKALMYPTGIPSLHICFKILLDEVAGQLELKAHLYKQLEKQTSQLSDQVKEKETACLTLRRKVVEAEKKLKERAQMFECELLTCKEKVA
ncbi:hypothetical protein L1887_44440 [Cichorium endivia]|nr:hypothetical protein L1887_44440 [Cichorium endivia]